MLLLLLLLLLIPPTEAQRFASAVAVTVESPRGVRVRHRAAFEEPFVVVDEGTRDLRLHCHWSLDARRVRVAWRTKQQPPTPLLSIREVRPLLHSRSFSCCRLPAPHDDHLIDDCSSVHVFVRPRDARGPTFARVT